MLKLTHTFPELRTPLIPPNFTVGPYKKTDGLLGWGDSGNIVMEQILPGGVAPSVTRLCIGAFSLRTKTDWGFGSATFKINGVAAGWALARRDSTVASVIIAGLLNTGIGGDTVEFSCTGGTGSALVAGGQAFLVDGIDLVTTWTTPIDSGSDTNAAPSVVLTGLLKGCLTICVAGIRSGSAGNTITNMTMIGSGELFSQIRYYVGYRISAADENITPVGSDASNTTQSFIALSLNQTIDSHYT